MYAMQMRTPNQLLPAVVEVQFREMMRKGREAACLPVFCERWAHICTLLA